MARPKTNPTPIVVTTQFAKSTGLVEIAEPEGRLSLADRRLFDHLLANAYKDLANGRLEFNIPLIAIKKFAADARGTETEDMESNTRLKKSLSNLQRVLVQGNALGSEGKVWESSPLLGPVRLNIQAGLLTYKFSEEIAAKLIEPALYSYISLRVIYQFQSKYGLILYQILKRYSDRSAETPYWRANIAELRDVLGCRDKLKDYKDFRRKAIEPGIEEINELAEFTIEIDEIRQGGGRGGGRVAGVVFYVHRKERQDAERAARELEKPKTQRQGEKAAKAEEAAAVRALRWLDGADAATRMKWAREAEHLGIVLPPAASARENLAKWVPAVAAVIVKAEKL
jgi:hypothetical protein